MCLHVCMCTHVHVSQMIQEVQNPGEPWPLGKAASMKQFPWCLLSIYVGMPRKFKNSYFFIFPTNFSIYWISYILYFQCSTFSTCVGLQSMWRSHADSFIYPIQAFPAPDSHFSDRVYGAAGITSSMANSQSDQRRPPQAAPESSYLTYLLLRFSFVCFTVYTGCHTEAKTGLELSHANPPASACQVCGVKGRAGKTAVHYSCPDPLSQDSFALRAHIMLFLKPRLDTCSKLREQSCANGRAHFTQDCHPQQLLPQKCQLCQVQNLQLKNVHMACIHTDMYTHVHPPLHRHQFILKPKSSHGYLQTQPHTTHRVHSTPRHSFPHLSLPF